MLSWGTADFSWLRPFPHLTTISRTLPGAPLPPLSCHLLTAPMEVELLVPLLGDLMLP